MLSLYLDEDLTPELARILRLEGFDVVSCHELGNTSIPDEKQLEIASAQGRAIITCNCGDFLQLQKTWFTQGRDHFGIVISYRQYSLSAIGAARRAILNLIATVDRESAMNTLMVLDQYRT